MLRLSALLSLALAAACFTMETEVRELPPRSAQAPPPRHVPPRPPPPRAPRPAAEPPDAPSGAAFQAPPSGAAFHVPPDRMPAVGLCRVWYDPLPPDRQPPAMTCARAHRVARGHGGRVIWAASSRSLQTGEALSADYGAVDLADIPFDRLPPPGYCRVWLDGIPPDRQPPPAQCPQAERDAERMGGRLVYMPSSDVR